MAGAGSARERLVRIFERYDKEQLPNVEAYLARHSGDEDRLIAALVKRYGPEPDPKPAEAPKGEGVHADFPVGATVEASGLQKAVELNSRQGTVLDSAARSDGRVLVDFPELGRRGVKPDNLRIRCLTELREICSVLRAQTALLEAGVARGDWAAAAAAGRAATSALYQRDGARAEALADCLARAEEDLAGARAELAVARAEAAAARDQAAAHERQGRRAAEQYEGRIALLEAAAVPRTMTLQEITEGSLAAPAAAAAGAPPADQESGSGALAAGSAEAEWLAAELAAARGQLRALAAEHAAAAANTAALEEGAKFLASQAAGAEAEAERLRRDMRTVRRGAQDARAQRERAAALERRAQEEGRLRSLADLGRRRAEARVQELEGAVAGHAARAAELEEQLAALAASGEDHAPRRMRALVQSAERRLREAEADAAALGERAAGLRAADGLQVAMRYGSARRGAAGRDGRRGDSGAARAAAAALQLSPHADPVALWSRVEVSPPRSGGGARSPPRGLHRDEGTPRDGGRRSGGAQGKDALEMELQRSWKGDSRLPPNFARIAPVSDGPWAGEKGAYSYSFGTRRVVLKLMGKDELREVRVLTDGGHVHPFSEFVARWGAAERRRCYRDKDPRPAPFAGPGA